LTQKDKEDFLRKEKNYKEFIKEPLKKKKLLDLKQQKNNIELQEKKKQPSAFYQEQT
jgi:hypothetical protein